MSGEKSLGGGVMMGLFYRLLGPLFPCPSELEPRVVLNAPLEISNDFLPHPSGMRLVSLERRF